MFDHLRGRRTYHDERQRLLEVAMTLDPLTPEYKTAIDRIDNLDKITKRSHEKTKVIVPACITAASLVGIYALQQLTGYVLPKALDAITARSTNDRNEKD